VTPDDALADPLSFLARRVPPAFELRAISVAPGDKRAYDEDEWRDALVVVERGEIELEWAAGARMRLGSGAVLWLVGLPLRAVHNRGVDPALVVAVSRRLA
jgi:hypothetical protein